MAAEVKNVITEDLQKSHSNEPENSMEVDSVKNIETKKITVAVETSKEIEKNKEQLQDEVKMLTEKLKETEQTVEESQSNLKLQQTRTKQLISIWKTHVERNEANLKRQGMERDQQLGEVISQLLFFEGQLRKEQKRIVSLLADKDEQIQRQEEQISELALQNDHLLKILGDVKGARNKNGVIQEVCSSTNDSGVFDISLPSDFVPPLISSDKSHAKPISRFNAVKNRLRRHKSNLELRNIESTILEETPEELSLSQENVVCRRNNPRRASRERCKSIAGYPIANDPGLEGCDVQKRDHEIIDSYRNADDNISLPEYSDLSPLSVNGHLGFETVAKRPNDYLTISVQSLINLTDSTNFNLGSMSGREKLRSASSSDVRIPSVLEEDSGKTDMAQETQRNSPTHEGKSSPTSDSNPFKTFKSMLKRRGSKLRKKRAVSLQQTTSPEQKEAGKRNKENKSKK